MCGGMYLEHLYISCLYVDFQDFLPLEWSRSLPEQQCLHDGICQACQCFSLLTLKGKCWLLGGHLSTSLTQVHVGQLRDIPHDDQEVEAKSLVGLEEQETKVTVPFVCLLHAVLWRDVEASLWGWDRNEAEDYDAGPGCPGILHSMCLCQYPQDTWRLKKVSVP